jgi:hypothetical protein
MAASDPRLLLRLGAACLVIGSLAVLAFRLAHGDLPTDTGAEALAFVAGSRFYPLIHLGDWLGVLVWTGGLVALAAALIHPTAWALGRLGAASALLGAAVHITEFSVDGYALPTLANAWVVAAPADRAGLEYGARLALVVIGGPSTSALLILWGPTLVLFGLAVRGDGYPAILGWAGVAIGAVIAVLGTIQYLAPNAVFPGVVLYGFGTIVSQAWTFVLGIAMWRRAARAAGQPAAVAPAG